MEHLILVLILFLFLPPSSPVAVWTAPGELTITYTGGVLWYQRPNLPTTFLDCPSPCVLKAGGTDHLYSAQVGATAWVQNAEGGTSVGVLVPPEPLWFTQILPLVVVDNAIPVHALHTIAPYTSRGVALEYQTARTTRTPRLWVAGLVDDRAQPQTMKL